MPFVVTKLVGGLHVGCHGTRAGFYLELYLITTNEYYFDVVSVVLANRMKQNSCTLSRSLEFEVNIPAMAKVW